MEIDNKKFKEWFVELKNKMARNEENEIQIQIEE
jgi:hypothetical protein